jgi:hypothetical protein
VSVRLYTDVHVPFAITAELRIRGVDVLTAQADAASRFEDPALLARATHLGRVLFSQDDDLLKVAATWQANGTTFSGLIYAHTPLTFAGGHTMAPANLNHVRWVSHCRDLVQLPTAA